MRAIKQVKKFIENDPTSKAGQTFSRLILSLESDEEFLVKDLYQLDTQKFDLAMEVLKDWRIDRFYLGKAKVFDAATHAQALSTVK
jgi:predicted DNA-binding protein (UPF0251 family)